MNHLRPAAAVVTNSEGMRVVDTKVQLSKNPGGVNENTRSLGWSALGLPKEDRKRERS